MARETAGQAGLLTAPVIARAVKINELDSVRRKTIRLFCMAVVLFRSLVSFPLQSILECFWMIKTRKGRQGAEP